MALTVVVSNNSAAPAIFYCTVLRKVLVYSVLTIVALYSAGLAGVGGDFAELIASGLYVDKSLFIREFLKKTGTGQFSFVVRPKGWGKSTNLDMLKRFFEIEVDPQDGGNVRRRNRALFTGNAGAVNRLKIAEEDDYVMKQQGEYPVLSISFRNITGASYDEIERKLRTTIGHLFRRYEYLSVGLDSERKRTFHSYCADDVDDDPVRLDNGLQFLTGLLHERFQRTVYVLLDDYDVPVNSLLLARIKRLKSQNANMQEWAGYRDVVLSEEFNKTLLLLDSLLTDCFIDNPVLERGLICGTFIISVPDWFERLAAAAGALSTCLGTEFSEFYGFSEREVDYYLFNRSVVVGTGRDKPTVKDWNRLNDWYGYNFTGTRVFNPSSIIDYVRNGFTFDMYWRDDKRSSLAMEMFTSDEMQLKVQTFVDGGSVAGMVGTVIRFDRIWDELSMAVHSGYLSVKGRDGHVWDLTAPNRELLNICRDNVLGWMRRVYNCTMERHLAPLARNLINFEMRAFEANLRQLISEVVPELGLTLGQFELLYNGVIQGVVYSLKLDYFFLERFRPTGFEKPCLFIIPKRRETDTFGNAVILGYKILDDPDCDPKQNATEGLRQLSLYNVNRKRYSYIAKVVRVSLAFYRTNVTVDYTVYQYAVEK